jgi:uncharacterized phage protein gp47/JayE
MSGLTDQGLIIKDFPEIVLEIEDGYIGSFGEDVNLEEESVNGQIINILALTASSIWAALPPIYAAQFVATATGLSLDYAVGNRGLTRLAATATIVNTKVTVTNPTTLLEGTEAGSTDIDAVFKLTSDLLINNTACIEANVTIATSTEVSYIININGTPYEYEPFVIDDTPQIADALMFLINDASIGITANKTDASTLSITSDTEEDFSIVVSTGITLNSITQFAVFTSSTKGFIQVPANTLTNIITPIAGWLSVYNPLAGVTGRNIETDVELRSRFFQSLRIGSTGTVEALRAGIRNVAGVTVADVYENYELFTVGGIPSKAFESVVLGGEDVDIAKMIWSKKPAGIEPYGSISVIIQDSEGIDQLVKFSRPTPVYVFVEITITLDASNTYPVNGDEVIKNSVLEKIKALNVGQDVIYQSFYQSVFSVSGIESATIQIGGTTDELTPPTLSSNNIVIGAAQAAISDLTKITIITL